MSWFLGVAQPPAVDAEALTYEPFFGLREKPFSIAADPRFFFAGSGHGAAFDTLVAGIKRREGILILTGEVGTGKTTLCRAVLQSLNEKTFAAAVSDPLLSREDLLKTLLVDFGVLSSDETRRGALRGTTRADLSYALYDFLASLESLKAFAVLLIDEAQNLTADTLEEIRILSDLERGQKLLQVVLIGQPELADRLNDSALRQLAQRITVRCELLPLTRDEIAGYLSHRLMVAGNDGRASFTDGAIDDLYSASAGIPRLVNVLADRAMTRAASLQTTTVDADCVAWARGDLKSAAPPPSLALVHNQPEDLRRRDADAEEKPIAESELPSAPQPLVNMVTGLMTADAPESPAEPTQTAAATEVLPQPAPRQSSRPAKSSNMKLVAASLVILALVGAYALWPRSSAPGPGAGVQQPQPQQSTTGSGRQSAAPAAPAPAPTPAPTPAADATAAGAPAADQNAANAPTRLAVLVATFLTEERTAKAVQELADAGLSAFSVPVPLRDGSRALAIYVGPYDRREDAERDLERAHALPGYEGARIVSVKPTVHP